jgi:hypothetical protein
VAAPFAGAATADQGCNPLRQSYGCRARGLPGRLDSRRYLSYNRRRRWGVAKLVRHGTLDPACAGSSPASPATFLKPYRACGVFNWLGTNNLGLTPFGSMWKHLEAPGSTWKRWESIPARILSKMANTPAPDTPERRPFRPGEERCHPFFANCDNLRIVKRTIRLRLQPTNQRLASFCERSVSTPFASTSQVRRGGIGIARTA